MIGGVLVERTVKDVLPALENNKEQVSSYSIFIVYDNVMEMVMALDKYVSLFYVFVCCFGPDHVQTTPFFVKEPIKSLHYFIQRQLYTEDKRYCA